MPSRKTVKSWVAEEVKGYASSVGCILFHFCGDAELLPLNQRYLGHNTLTDIITFDYSEGRKRSGEIFISLDRVKENAEELRNDVKEELRRVMIHGVLHLCGLKDKTKLQKKEMRAAEAKALKHLRNLLPT